MSESNSFHVSQEYSVKPLKPRDAIVVSCEEWGHVKSKVKDFRGEFDYFQTCASLLLGVALSTLTAILTSAIPSAPPAAPGSPTQPGLSEAYLVAWAVIATSAICGVIALVVAHRDRASRRKEGDDVVKQMEMIEKRFEE